MSINWGIPVSQAASDAGLRLLHAGKGWDPPCRTAIALHITQLEEPCFYEDYRNETLGMLTSSTATMARASNIGGALQRSKIHVSCMCRRVDDVARGLGVCPGTRPASSRVSRPHERPHLLYHHFSL